MRPSVLSFGVLALTLCGLILWQSRSVKNSSTGSERVTLTTPAAIPPVEKHTETESISSMQTQSPPWEISFAEIDEQPEWLQSQEELEQLADAIPDSQLRAALDELLNSQSSASIIVARRLLQRWADTSPDAAAVWVTHLSDNVFGQAMSREIAACWSQQDLAAATEWAQGLPNGETKTAAIASLAFEAATQKQTSTAISLATTLPPSTERDNLLSYGYQQWAATDPDSAVSGLTQIEDPNLREGILAKVAINLAAEDPPAAAQMIMDNMQDGNLRDDALGCAVRFWAAATPEKAIAWLEQLPEGHLRATAIDDVIEVCRKQDPSERSPESFRLQRSENSFDGSQ